MKRTYTLRSFSRDRLSRVSREWAPLAGEEEFEVELAPVFDWCVDHLVHREGDAHALELYAPDHGDTDMILEMVNGRRGSLSKLLKVHISPRFWPAADGDEGLLDELVHAYASAFTLVIGSGMQGGFDEIKIYGRREGMFAMLKRLQSEWSLFGTEWTASMQGRWLSIKK